MADRYQRFVSSGFGRGVAKRLGLPQPATLRRYDPDEAFLPGPVLCDGTKDGTLADPVTGLLTAAGIDVVRPAAKPSEQPALAELPNGTESFAALVFDASGIADTDGLRALYDFFHPVARRIRPSGRVIVLGRPPETCKEPRAAIAQQALEGFVRSVAKELGRGSTAQLLYVADDASDAIESTLRFLLSGRSAYVSGQVVRIGAAGTGPAAGVDWARPLAGQVALVTGAARGIGEAIARTLARDGAQVVCLDVPSQGDQLAAVAGEIGGTTLQIDITRDSAPELLTGQLLERFDAVDVVVHNAGITRDRTLARMSSQEWDSVLDVNLRAQQDIDDALLERKALRSGGRVIAVSSVNGIAGARGQTNYAASKAGVIGRVRAMTPVLLKRGITINAVAPGFIDTAMTQAMPTMLREVAGRMNSLAQPGLPIDVAETVAWLATPASYAVTGNVVRVCGQHQTGA
jgi:3-oxoacyl-[acyl-carrier protein] reductase